MSIIAERLRRALDLTDALAADLSPVALTAHNGTARSNTVGAQFWCIVGARESYTKAFDAGAWQGFACSLTEPASPTAVRAALGSSHDALVARLDDAATASIDEVRTAVLADLLEHEVQHHGQLIRYFYANDLAFPPEFAARYAL
jgi:hypothetical protein